MIIITYIYDVELILLYYNHSITQPTPQLNLLKMIILTNTLLAIYPRLLPITILLPHHHSYQITRQNCSEEVQIID